MQSIGKLVASQADYYVSQIQHSVGEDVPVLRGDRAPDQVDYYANHQSPSRWMGSGLERVRLQTGGRVDGATFQQLMRHQTPAGESMVRRFASHGKVAAFDHTFSAPKSVSLMYAFGEDSIRSAVASAHQRAVAEALDYMEQHSSQSRLATKHKDPAGQWKVSTQTVESEGYVAAAFDHFTSRANDPQVHTHVVVINRVWARDGWRAIDAKRAYAHAKAGGSVYQAVLRDQLTRTLGVSWQPVVNGMADIAGFSSEVLRHFSTRRSEITEAVNRYIAQTGGEAHRRVWQAFTLETRQPKAHPAGEAEVTREMKDYGITSDSVAHWQRRAADAPEDVAAVVRAAVGEAHPSWRPTDAHVTEAAQRLVEWVSDRHAVFTERDLVAHVSSLFPEGGRRHDLESTTSQLLRAAQDNGDVLTIVPHAESGVILPEGVTLTPEELDVVNGQGPGWVQQGETVRFRALPGEARYTTRIQLEREQRILEALNHKSSVVPDGRALERAIRVRELVEGQAQAVRHLANLDGRVAAVVGPGGSGKTYSIGAYADAVTSAGHPAIGVATSAAAARKLSEDLGNRWTGTIAMLRHQLEASPDPLRPGTLIVVDEASMVSTTDLAWLVEQVESCEGKLVLVGDPKQLPSVDSGGLFHRIVATGDQVVTDLAAINQRQQLDFDRDTLAQLRGGEIEKTVHDYAEAGRLHLGRDEYATKAAMVDAWWADVQEYGLDGVRMLSSRQDEVAMLNELARVRMLEAGALCGPGVVNRWGNDFRAGDRVVVRDNWYAYADLRNGQTGAIVSVQPVSGTATFRRDLDGEVIELPKRYIDRNVDHAYAQTIHTAQGQTFQATHVFVDTGVQAEHGYTALSRARGETHLWVDDSPGPLGECTHIQGSPFLDDRVAALASQLGQSVIEPPAYDQGLPVASALDRQLFEWREELMAVIRRSPIAIDPGDQIVALGAAIDGAREAVERFGTSGLQAQVRQLEEQRGALVEQSTLRGEWLEANAPLLQQYSAVAEETRHRVNARVASYEFALPDEVLHELGPKPSSSKESSLWGKALHAYAEARFVVSATDDLSDAALLAKACWRDAADIHHRTVTGEIQPSPALRRAV